MKFPPLEMIIAFLALTAGPLFGQLVQDPDTGLRSGTITANGNTYAIASGTMLAGANLEDANLIDVDLSVADLSGANLRGADLSGAELTGANLNGADLTGAYLDFTILFLADVSNVNFSGVDLGFTDLELTVWNTPDPRIAELEAQLASALGLRDSALAERDAAVAERDAAISERDARYTEEQIRALSPDYTMGLNEAGNVEVKISFIASSDAENFAPLSVTADSVSVVDGKVCMELPPDQGAFFYRFRIE